MSHREVRSEATIDLKQLARSEEVSTLTEALREPDSASAPFAASGNGKSPAPVRRFTASYAAASKPGG